MREQVGRLLLKEPYYGSQLDERALFQWLQAIPGVLSVNGMHYGFELIYRDIDKRDEFLREILSIYSRYNLDLSELKLLLNNTPEWVLVPTAYWYERLVAGLPEILSAASRSPDTIL